MRIQSKIVYTLALVASCLSTMVARAQSPPDPNYVRQQIYPSYNDFKNDLLATVGIADPGQRTTAINNLWSTLQNAGQVPYAQDNQVAFLYRGSGSSISWPGDFNGWNPSPSGWQGTQFAGTDLWILEKTFPTDARLDYKIVRNGTWILDPANSLQMWGGFGPNSELRMPSYIFPQETVRQTGVPQGTLSGNITTASSNLGYSVNYRVYTPNGYNAAQLKNLPVVYVTDGHEYSADHLGSTVVVLDNLIDQGLLQPMMAVFIDPRDPFNGTNRRQSQYTGNANFASFVADELVPQIDANYRTLDSPTGRTILGTSLGGVNSAYFGATRSDVFENIAVQSPSNFSSIFNLYASQSLQDDVDLYVTAGTIGDGSGGVSFTNLLAANGYDYTFTQHNEGHSWGQWRGLLDDMLINLVGAQPILSADFNEDGFVGQGDLASWNSNYGLTAGAAHGEGDSDSNRRVDGFDFLAWQTQYGKGALGAVSSPTTAVPEPSGAVLISLAMVVLFRHRIRRA